MLVEDAEHPLHRLGNGVVRGEVVPREERLEDGPGDEVLGEHLDRVGLGDAVVEVAPQTGEEDLELLGGGRLRVREQAGDPGNVLLGDLGDVLGPGLPVATLADLLDDARVDGVAPLLDPEWQRELRRASVGAALGSGRRR